MGKNANMRKAASTKDDEFYTQLSDIENELKHYKEHFKGKVVFCNCDDPEESNFWKYFSLNFERLGLKKLVSTHFKDDEKTYKLEISKDINGDGKINWKDVERTVLEGNGDFRSPESIKILKEADIVVTNPPFSLFREYVAQLMEHNKRFLIVGPGSAATYREIVPYIMDNNVWLGNCGVKSFARPDGSIRKFGNINWFTNLDHNKRHEEIILFKKYKGNEDNYPRYDNYNAISVDKLKDIPMDYEGEMGVPASILNHLNHEQFEMIDCIGRYSQLTGPTDETRGKFLSMVNGKAKFIRIIVKNKKVIK